MDGRDPAAEKRDTKTAPRRDRVADLLERFIAQRLAQNRSGGGARQAASPRDGKGLGGQKLHEIAKRDVVKVISAIEQRGAPVAANKTLKSIKRFPRWCVGRAISISPRPKGSRCLQRRPQGTRVPTDHELGPGQPCRQPDRRRLMRHRRVLGAHGQRREEVARLAWDELDLTQRVLTLPAARTKNAKPHLMHLVGSVYRRPQSGAETGGLFVFSVFGDQGHFTISAELSGRLIGPPLCLQWRLHVIGWSCYSCMVPLGIAMHCRQIGPNHQVGTIFRRCGALSAPRISRGAARGPGLMGSPYRWAHQ